MRLFVAVDLPVEGKHRLWESLAPLRASAPDVRWTAAEAVHLTLKFLGEVDGARVVRIVDRLARVAVRHASFELRIAGIGAFPSVERARVWWAGIEPEPRLLSLQADTEEALVSEGFPRDDRPFTAHVTIGRTARGAKPLPAAAARAAVAAVQVATSWTAESVDLVRSHLGSADARYETLARALLHGAVPDGRLEGVRGETRDGC